MRHTEKQSPGSMTMFKVFPVTLVLLGMANIVLAAGGEGGHVEFEPILSMAMLWRVVNFAVLFSVLYYFMAKPLRSFFAARTDQILKSLEEAKRSKEEAEARFQELTQRLANRDQEFEEIRRRAVENAEKTKAQIIEEAHKRAKKMEEKAKESIEQEVKKAKEMLKNEAAELALKISRERLVKEIKPADHERFTDKYIAGIK